MSPPRERVFAACAPGLEPVLARELERLGLSARAVPGGAEAEGEDAVALACLGCRAADSVSLRLYQGPPGGLEAARREARRRFGEGAPLAARRAGPASTLSLDAAGAPLFKRGWRARVGAAPLRESLAAGMLLSCGYDGSVPFLDPMCGSGTLAIEAALIAARRAPGLSRRFAFESWPGHDATRTRYLRARLEAEAREPPRPIHASDRNGGAVRLATRNAEAAGVSAWVRPARAEAAGVAPPPGPGLCAVNPPYGRRLDDDAEGAWRALAALLPRLAGWTLAVLAPQRRLEDVLGRRPEEALPVRNGGLRCRLLRYRL
ncbi:MAG TPA: RNA methyltransferase [Anaeromyxobacteraceae bacterium]|nr:RNA methyltransferase [Anaeromyxobacteraceae bacterium]